MKKIITFVALIALTATATAQNESMGFGIRGGGSITGYNGKTEANYTNVKYKAGYYVGIFSDSQLLPFLDLRTELLFSSYGAKWEFTQGNEKYSNTLHTQYINLPILARLKIGNLGILAGVQGGILVNKPSLENTFNGRTVKLDRSDFAKFDFEGFVDGVAFEGGKAENYVLEIGSNQFIPGFEDGMVGIKAGGEKDIDVKFPENYSAAHLAGKDAVFKVKLHEIQERKIPEKLDEEMLKTILPNEEKPTEELLEERIKEQIRQEKIYKLINEELKPKFAEAAVEKFKFDVPKNIVEQEIDMQFRNAWSSFTPDDMKKFREDKDALAKKRDEYRKDAENSVRLTFIIDELARVRGVKVSDQEVVQAIYFEAYRSGQDPKAHLEMYRNQGMLPAIKMSMIEEKLFSELFSKEKDEKKASKKEKAE